MKKECFNRENKDSVVARFTFEARTLIASIIKMHDIAEPNAHVTQYALKWIEKLASVSTVRDISYMICLFTLAWKQQHLRTCTTLFGSKQLSFLFVNVQWPWLRCDVVAWFCVFHWNVSVGLTEGNKPEVFQFNCFAFDVTGETSSLLMIRILVIAFIN